MDYRALLKKYLRKVSIYEGRDFIHDSMIDFGSLELTEHERAELDKLMAEIEKEDA